MEFLTVDNKSIMNKLFSILVIILFASNLHAQLTTQQIIDLVKRSVDSVRLETKILAMKTADTVRREFRAADTTNLKDKLQSDSIAALFNNIRPLDNNAFVDSAGKIWIRPLPTILNDIDALKQKNSPTGTDFNLLKNYLDRLKPWLSTAPIN